MPCVTFLLILTITFRNIRFDSGFMTSMVLGILVFDMAQSTSWRTTNHLYNPDPFASDYTYQNLSFQWTDGVFGASLSPLNKPAGDRVLYFHPMSSNNVT